MMILKYPPPASFLNFTKAKSGSMPVVSQSITNPMVPVGAMVTTLELRTDRMAEAADSPFAAATDLAEYLVVSGMPFREAHEVVGRMVRDLLATNRDFASLSPDDWRRYHNRLDADAAGRITARGSVAARRTPQSTAPDAVASALLEVRRWVDERTVATDH